MLVSNKAKILLLLFGVVFAAICQAISFGELKVYSYLGEPLYAEIELTGYEGFDTTQLVVNLADAKDFARAGIERPYFLNFLVFQTMTYNHKLYVVVRTSKPVKSPYIEFLIELSWPGGNLIKEYTILLDPPPADLSTESRPKSAQQIAEAKAAANVSENSIQEQLNLQKAQQQKAQAEASLAGVVREGNNKFSDQSFDLVQKPASKPAAAAPTAAEISNAAQDYQEKRKAYLNKEAAEQAEKSKESVLQNVVADVDVLSKEASPDITVQKILAE